MKIKILILCLICFIFSGCNFLLNADRAEKEIGIPQSFATGIADENDGYEVITEANGYKVNYNVLTPLTLKYDAEKHVILFLAKGEAKIEAVYEKNGKVMKKLYSINVKENIREDKISAKTGDTFNLKKVLQYYDYYDDYKIVNLNPEVLETRKDDMILCIREGIGKVAVEFYRDNIRVKTIVVVLEIKGGKVIATRIPSHFAEDVLKYTNQYRQQYGLAPLQLHPLLGKLAGKRAKDISVYFSHSLASGEKNDIFKVKFEDIYGKISVKEYQRKYNKLATSFTTGENLASGCDTAKEAVEGWFKSPGHRANLLHTEYRFLGVGCYFDNQTVTESSTTDYMMIMDKSGKMRKPKSQDYTAKNNRIYWVQLFAG